MARGRGRQQAVLEGAGTPQERRARSTESTLFAPRRSTPGWQITGVVNTTEYLFATLDEEDRLVPARLNARRPLCEACGAPLRYAYRLQNRAGERRILGSECCRAYLGMSGEQAARTRVWEDAAERERSERRARAEALELERVAIHEEAFARDQDVYVALRERGPADPDDRNRSAFLDDLAHRWRQDRLLVLSEAQVEAARRAIVQERERMERQAKWDAERVIETHREGEAVSLEDCEVVSVKHSQTAYGNMVGVVLRGPSGHTWYYRTNPETASGRMLAGMHAGDRLAITKARVRGQSDDQGMTYLTRATLAPVTLGS